MANLSEMGLDPNVKEDDGVGSGNQLVPPGKYKSVMIREEISDNNKKNGKLFKSTWQVVEGPHSDTILFDNWNLSNPNQQCVDIGLGVLRRVCRITGVPYPPSETAHMLGKPTLLTVGQKPKWDKSTGKDHPTKKVNEITAYNPVPADFVAADPKTPDFNPIQHPPAESKDSTLVETAESKATKLLDDDLPW